MVAKLLTLQHTWLTAPARQTHPCGRRETADCGPLVAMWWKDFSCGISLNSPEGQKTREGCGCFRDLFGGSRGKLREIPGKMLEKISRIAKCFKFQNLGTQERQTCRELWADTPGTLSQPSVRGVFWNRQLQPSRVFLRRALTLLLLNGLIR